MRLVSFLGRFVITAGAIALFAQHSFAQDGVVRLPQGPAPSAPAAASPTAPKPDDNGRGTANTQPLAPQGLIEGVAPPVNPSTFRVGPEDVLDIQVWREPQLSGQVVVRPDGRITATLLGEIEVGGKTIDEIQKILVTKYSEVMNDPVVNVQPRAIRSSKYFITGFVPRPGMYPLVVDTSILDAIIMAGGLMEIANPKKIRIQRKGQKPVFFNYNDVSKGKNLDQNINLQNNDYIFVN